VSLHKPTKAEIQAAAGRSVPDVIAPDLWVLFCGINPSLYSGATGHHFARPGNRFWPALYGAGFTDRLLAPSEDHELLVRGLGITNLVERATTAAAELSPQELAEGGERLRAKIERYRPRVLAILGISAYRLAFGLPKAVLGRQQERIAATHIYVLPNPSGLNAHYTPAELARVYGEFRTAIVEI
jgi:TDG/mug DNA glycosylase family protein